MKVNTKPYKGARDFYPEDKRLQKWMFDKWRRVVERYGYLEYDAPILERTELYLMKGSEEIVNDQTYTFKDRGDRSVTIRTEMTPSVSRIVAGKRQELAYPVRWYSIPNLWRYERMQRGRLREFWQLNVDIFGVESQNAELEMIQITDGLFREFKAKRSSYTIKINSRVLVNSILKESGVTGEKAISAIRLMDKIDKISPSDFKEALGEIVGQDNGAKLIKIIKSEKISDLPDYLQKMECTKTLKTVLDSAVAMGITNVKFDLSLMRGFDYYTDIVFEVFDNNPDNNRSMFGGGRYDGLIGQFGVDPVPTVGFGMGDVTFMDFLKSNKLLSDLPSTTDIVVLPRDVDSINIADKVASELRESGVNVAVDYSKRKIDKQLKSAVKSGTRYALFVGGDLARGDKYTLKDIKSGKEEIYTVRRIADVVADSRKK